ncbi:unnamed protein product [Candida verbasci]|uniref:Peptide hydrolase n=1 Tax=Candida verbasci TaxID=1227364 RepID=A0A9W4TUJ8_9ASCO|nr:unnamed protein product [Candida verbasci]
MSGDISGTSNQSNNHGSTNDQQEDINIPSNVSTPLVQSENASEIQQFKPQQQLVTPPATSQPNNTTTSTESTSLLRRIPSTTSTNYTEDNYDSMSISTKIVNLAKRPSFIWISCLGIIAIIIFNLTFLPRTSLARDYRRWHDIHLTKSDVERDFLQLTSVYDSDNDNDNDNNKNNNKRGKKKKKKKEVNIKDSINSFLLNLTDLQNEYNLVASDNLKLTNYIQSNFKKMGLKTETTTYSIHDSKPISSSLKLLNKDETVYQPKLFENNFKTPSYFLNGHNGSVINEYVYVNEGLPKDYNLLKKKNIEIKDKIFIISNDLDNKNNITIGEKLKLAELNGASGILTYYQLNSNLNQDTNLNSVISRDFNNFNISIPAIPVSEKIIKPILETLRNDEEFENWSFHPRTNSNFKLEITTIFKNDSSKLTNIIGTIKGIMNDGDIIVGTNRDSYTNNNPLSGHVIMLEIIRSFNLLVKLGWKPLRNIKFVSWDGSNMDSLGLKMYSNISSNFKKPILSYINIDQDAIIGSHFQITANSIFNHVLKKTTKFIPFKNDSFTLFQYWNKQDNLTIENNLGLPLLFSTDSLVFQHHLNTPIINVKFSNDQKRDNSIYLPNSNYYNYNWLLKQPGIDDELDLHATLIRYLGLLVISLSEHEVVDYKTEPYFKQAEQYYKDFLTCEGDNLSSWSNNTIPNYLIYKSSIFQDLDTNEPVKFDQIVQQLSNFLNETTYQSKIFDDWNINVENGLIKDYPWYLYYKKLQHFAQFKVSNYKLLHFEKDLKLNDKDYIYLNLNEDGSSTTGNELFYDSIIFNTPDLKNNEEFFKDRFLKSTFGNLYKAIDDENFEMSVKWIVLIYEKIKNLEYKMT